MKNKVSCTLLFFLVSIFQTFGQEEHEVHGEDEENGQAFESVLSALYMYTPESGVFDPASELHLTYWVTHKWAFGASYSIIFEEEGRTGHELAPLISHKPTNFLTLNAGPSFALPNSEQEFEIAAYVESEFAFEIGIFHMGPTLGALIGEELRLFSGWHLSCEF